MIVFCGGIAVKARFRGNIHLAADNRLDLRRLAGAVKLHGSVHCAVVGQGNGAMSLARRRFGYFVYPACTVQQTVSAVQVQMNKTAHRFPLLRVVYALFPPRFSAVTTEKMFSAFFRR